MAEDVSRKLSFSTEWANRRLAKYYRALNEKGERPMKDLQQFVGGTLLRVSKRANSLSLEVRLSDGSTRDLDLYTLVDTRTRIHTRIDGMYVPPEDE